MATEVEMLREKVAKLHHVCQELRGTIVEYRNMPCGSLRTRMFQTAQRYNIAILNCAPSVTVGEWNERLINEELAHQAFLKRVMESEPK